MTRKERKRFAKLGIEPKEEPRIQSESAAIKQAREDGYAWDKRFRCWRNPQGALCAKPKPREIKSI